MKEKHSEIIKILTIIRSKINPDTDVTWTPFDTVEELLNMIDNSIQGVKRKDKAVINELRYRFAPTATFQELAMSNGWGDEYLILADRFDEAIKESWLQRLLSKF
ncbi:MAG: hypothetical protein M0D57_15120 [Sphingobacteriales bacterium JAD_PAG50586_3]|nr:MAG: hypothetical protein M0D57_15120 [Sphingobacteriales bacterium JAD_PAG50586_3]